MKITIRDGNSHYHFWVPVSFLSSRLFWKLYCPAKDFKVPKLAHRLVKELKRYRRKHGPWTLVEIHSGEDEDVIIRF
jgi:hypothetical protein